MPIIDILNATIFSAKLPDMPPLMREMWQAAYLFRRKYATVPKGNAEVFFDAVASDMIFISQSYNNDEQLISLLAEVFCDIERQWKQKAQEPGLVPY